MPKERDRPGISEPRWQRRLRVNDSSGQPLVPDRLNDQLGDRRVQVIHTAALHTQRPYQAWSTGTGQPSSPVPAALTDSAHQVSDTEQPQFLSLTTSHRSPSARRRSQVLNGVAYASPIAEVHSRHVTHDSERYQGDDCEEPRFVGCKPLYPDSSGYTRHFSRQQEISQALSQQRPQFLQPPPAHAPRRNTNAHRPSSNGFSHCYQDKPFPVPQPVPAVEPPVRDTCSAPLHSQTARPYHRELHYDEQGSPLAPGLRVLQSASSELEGNHLPLRVVHPNHARASQLGTRSYLTRYCQTQSAGREPEGDGVQHNKDPLRTLESAHEPQVVRDTAADNAVTEHDEHTQPSTTWYKHYVQARTWEYEDVTDAYDEFVESARSRAGKPGRDERL